MRAACSSSRSSTITRVTASQAAAASGEPPYDDDENDGRDQGSASATMSSRVTRPATGKPAATPLPKVMMSASTP